LNIKKNKGKSNTFTSKFYCYKLIYFEHFSNVEQAIDREKQIKNWTRKKKENIINIKNPNWNFLNDDIFSL